MDKELKGIHKKNQKWSTGPFVEMHGNKTLPHDVKSIMGRGFLFYAVFDSWIFLVK